MPITRQEAIRRIKMMETRGEKPETIQQYLDSVGVVSDGGAGSADTGRKTVADYQEEARAVLGKTGNPGASLLGYIGKDIRGTATPEDRPSGFKGFVGDLFTSTAGRVLGVAGAPFRPTETAKKGRIQEEMQSQRFQLARNADQFIQMANKEADPAQKRKYLDIANRILRQTEDVQQSVQDVQRTTPQSTSVSGDIKRVAGQAVGAVATLAPYAGGVGLPGMTGKVHSGLSRPPVSVPTSFGQAVKHGAATGAKYGGAFGASGALVEDRTIPQILGRTASGAATGGILGGVLGGTTYGVHHGLAARRGGLQRPEQRFAATEQVMQQKFRGGPAERAREIPKAERTLTRIDTKGVRTHQQLSQRLDDSIKADTQKVDDILEPLKETHKLSKLAQKTTETYGGKTVTVKSNPVRDALKHMHELYLKSGDSKGQARISLISKKANAQGLTAKEINQIAREYGRVFGGKAFSRVTGDPLTSVSALKYEGTRSGVKQVARSLIPDERTTVLDRQIHEAISTKLQIDKNAESIRAFEQKIIKGNIVQWAAKKLEGVVDIAMFGGPRAFVRQLVQGPIPTRADFIAVQGQAMKNLHKLNGKSEGFIANFITKVLLEASRQPNPGDALNQVFLNELLRLDEKKTNLGR